MMKPISEDLADIGAIDGLQQVGQGQAGFSGRHWRSAADGPDQAGFVWRS